MVSKYTVIIAETAKDSIDEINEYLSVIDEDVAGGVIAAIFRMIYSLDFMPKRFARPLQKSIAKKGYRHVVVKKYTLYYLVDDVRMTVNVIWVLHGAMNHARIINKRT